MAMSVVMLAACSDDASSTKGCPAGQITNPISGGCEPVDCPAGHIFNPIKGACVIGSGPDAGHLDTDPSGSDAVTQNNGLGDSGQQPGDTNTSNNTNPNNANNHCTGLGCDDDVIVVPDTGPGTPYRPQDPAQAQYHSCTSADTRNLVAPKFLSHTAGNYLLTTERSVNASLVTPTAGLLNAHVFEDTQNKFTGFVVSLAPQANQTTPAMLSQALLTSIQSITGMNTASLRHAGRQTLTHDQMSAVTRASILLPNGTAPHVARDAILARQIGLTAQNLGHTLTATFSANANAPSVLVYQIVRRSNQQYVLIAALATLADYENDALTTGTRIDDLVSGTALAYADESMTDQCVSYTIRDTNEVDIIISLDASGSMSGVQNALANFAQEFTQLLDATGADWRVGITGVDCDNIQNDAGLSQEYRNLWSTASSGAGGIFGIEICKTPFGIGGSGNNGKLIGGGFTRDFQQIDSRMRQVSTTGSEYTLTMGVAAIDRSLPRAENSASKIRPNAAVILVVVTDENEELFKQKFTFIGGTNQTLTGAQRTEMEAFARPWIEYLRRPDVDAPVFGLYWLPGQPCAGATDVAHDIDHFVTQTGGAGGSVCQGDVTTTFRDIADATRDLTSGLRLIGAPVATTIRVAKEGPNNVDSVLNRSRIDGFDFDATNNSVLFEGPSAPQVDERVVVPYMRWNRSVQPCETTSQCTGTRKCMNGVCR
ncbi:MAG: hypothetical protein H0U74_11110 [Bradymonadaceae bacterium]|nr:hypothetical protein [Lujinxingiaceae bacterium]